MAKRKSYYDPDKARAYREANDERIKQYRKEYYQKNKDKKQAREQRYRDTCPHYNARMNIARRIRSVITGDKLDTTLNYTGCTAQELVEHLESQFTEGMTWENYGLRGWHIDHIVPCSSFDLSKEEERYKCFHYSNLQPMWWRENIVKGNRQ